MSVVDMRGHSRSRGSTTLESDIVASGNSSRRTRSVSASWAGFMNENR